MEKTNIEYKLGCEFLYNFVSISPFKIMTCPDDFFGERSSFNVEYNGADNIQEALKKNLLIREQAIEALAKNEKTPCNNCEHLRWGYYPAKPDISRVGFCGKFRDEGCNFSCCYCNVPDNPSYPMDIIDVLRPIGDLFKGEKLKINFATMEFFIRHDCDDILKFCHENKYSVHFTTNGSVFREAVTALAKEGNVELINISLDSGTPETYARIKGVDCFKQTIENIKKYCALNIPITLKYIMLEGINDSRSEIEEFLKIAARLKTSIAISSNQFVKNTRLKRETLILIDYMIQKCKQNELNIFFYQEYFNFEDFIEINKMLEIYYLDRRLTEFQKYIYPMIEQRTDELHNRINEFHGHIYPMIDHRIDDLHKRIDQMNDNYNELLNKINKQQRRWNEKLFGFLKES